MTTSNGAKKAQETQLDVAVVGGGLGGLYALHRLRGLGFRTRAYEAGSGVGGTWFWNKYPGARCDVESLEYSYAFLRRAAAGVELGGALRDAAADPCLRKLCGREVRPHEGCAAQHAHHACELRRRAGRWILKTGDGETISARFCVMATGNLSTPRVPDFKGIETFKGKWYHTGMWPSEPVDFTGQRVGVVGTGSSGHPDDPAYRRAGRAPLRLSAHREFQSARPEWPDGERSGRPPTRPTTWSAAWRRGPRASAFRVTPFRRNRR